MLEMWAFGRFQKIEKNIFFIFFKIAYMFQEFEENVIIDFVHVFETNSGYMRHVEFSTGPPEYST